MPAAQERNRSSIEDIYEYYLCEREKFEQIRKILEAPLLDQILATKCKDNLHLSEILESPLLDQILATKCKDNLYVTIPVSKLFENLEPPLLDQILATKCKDNLYIHILYLVYALMQVKPIVAIVGLLILFFQRLFTFKQ
ncbi:uncharacterized protein TRIVIDRAFT_203434 [Trichoderma virens Gv29-8]|uniref:Uncharacterized protein n=1 Tax=Hypocrea virens (strain Gv29-8 / FGSC 10586) TaxID=413071 RepID=G9N0I6_HYPVG|nr:uncharacterized protein TRIVIDRAFT_203434 [Trichoderma virens Gv29-8]EHK19868.1 hypothetical protein TRIVIDRAFT_203434 [Trichoderma virens Gv29-8]